ncbi:hypothetical protein ACWC1D_36570, partial [Streptomyces sp. NPDC001478]
DRIPRRPRPRPARHHLRQRGRLPPRRRRLRRCPRNPLWVAAARDGLTDPELRAAAATCFDLALEALPRRGATARVQDAVARFRDRYVARGRCPADDLRGLLTTGRDRTPADAKGTLS